MDATRAALIDGANNARALGAIKDVQDFAALRTSLVQPSLEKASAYARSVYNVATSAQSELNKLVEEQVAEFNKNVVGALEKADSKKKAA